jgi:hypothetical protein
VYIESMGRTIANLFRAYHAQLAKLEMEVSAHNFNFNNLNLYFELYYEL